jgi:hypothetical protein
VACIDKIQHLGALLLHTLGVMTGIVPSTTGVKEW